MSKPPASMFLGLLLAVSVLLSSIPVEAQLEGPTLVSISSNLKDTDPPRIQHENNDTYGNLVRIEVFGYRLTNETNSKYDVYVFWVWGTVIPSNTGESVGGGENRWSITTRGLDSPFGPSMDVAMNFSGNTWLSDPATGTSTPYIQPNQYTSADEKIPIELCIEILGVPICLKWEIVIPVWEVNLSINRRNLTMWQSGQNDENPVWGAGYSWAFSEAVIVPQTTPRRSPVHVAATIVGRFWRRLPSPGCIIFCSTQTTNVTAQATGTFRNPLSVPALTPNYILAPLVVFTLLLLTKTKVRPKLGNPYASE